jgi:hypothetical protein
MIFLLFLLTVFPLPDNGTGIDVDGDLVYVTAGTEGLLIIDISDSLNPVLLSQTEISGYPEGVVVDYGTLFIAGGVAGVKIFNVRDPTAPDSVGYYLLGGSCLGFDRKGIHLFLAHGSSGISVLCSCPRNCVSPVSNYWDCVSWDVAVEGNLLYSVGGSEGISVFDISNFRCLDYVRSYNVGYVLHGIDVYDGKAYVTNNLPPVVLILDLVTQEVDTLRTDYFIHDVKVDAERIILSGADRIEILRRE